MENVNTPLGVLPLIGLGTFSIPHPVLRQLIPEALNLGYTLFDTAYKYQNEAELGKLIHSKAGRSACILETKVCMEQLWGNLRYLRLNAKSLKKCFRSACANLSVDALDVFMLHSAFPGYEKYFLQLLDLQQQGKVQWTGICNITLEQLQSLQAQVGKLPDIVQCEVHPYFSNKALIAFCQQNGMVVEARSPLAHGDALEEWAQEPVFQDLCYKYQKSVVQIVLRWITQQGVTALPRTSSRKHLEENIQIFDFRLTDEEMQRMDKLNRDQSYGFFSKKS